jgi:hypothetical protein
MNTNSALLRYVLIGIIVLVLAAFGGWYFFLKTAESTTNTDSAARGYGSIAPSFEGSTGSTYENAASTLASSGITPATSTSRLWQVSAVPVAGFGWTSDPIAKLSFVERSSGYVFEADLPTRAVTRLTDTLRPKTYEAIFAAKGSVLERSLDDSGAIITFAGVLATTTQASATSSPEVLAGLDLSSDIRSIAVDPASRTVFYMIDSSSGAALLSSDWTGAKEKHLFSSSIEDWRIFPLGNANVDLSQAAEDGVEGYAYQLQKDGSLALLAQGPGLTILPRASSAALLFGESSGGALSLFSQSSASSAPVELSIRTVADKCAWMPGQSPIAYCGVPDDVASQQFLDDWYKGEIHTSDQIWQVDAATGTTTLVYSPASDAGVPLDIEDPSVDPSGNYVAFTNAADKSLWVLRINK